MCLSSCHSVCNCQHPDSGYTPLHIQNGAGKQPDELFTCRSEWIQLHLRKLLPAVLQYRMHGRAS
jgi:hypothetical protein